ncbi:hypothetical protein OSB04_024686 [Centaurea solstitialis]|uniref:Uncharacterized protein n=1 Tax=Centaurea solstitialis TaxID=347529 RepID=A0AA38SLM8_9ASTR|nr:hypothetical protein OSB04_024686 [Centaurea solstitialis]
MQPLLPCYHFMWEQWEFRVSFHVTLALSFYVRSAIVLSRLGYCFRLSFLVNLFLITSADKAERSSVGAGSETSSDSVEPVSVLNPITETESSSNTLNEETVLSPSQLSSTQPSPETAVEAVRKQTVSTILAPIPEVVPPPSPSRTYAEVVREPCLETVLNTDPDASLLSSAIQDENDSRNNMEYNPIPHSRKWTRSHSTTNIIGSPSAPVTTRSSKKDENLILLAAS